MDIDRELEGGFPYYMNSHQAIYATRGLAAELDGRGITCSEWLEAVKVDAGLALDEVYIQHNPHAGYDETWREKGRVRWPAMGEPCEYIRWFPPHITATHSCRLPSRTLGDRFNRAVAEIGQFPTLAQWREYVVAGNRLSLEERFVIGGRQCYRPGRAVTTAAGGGEIWYIPAAVWMYYGMDVNGVSREAKLRELAARLDARVVSGNDFEMGCVEPDKRA